MSARDIKNNVFTVPTATPVAGTDEGAQSSSSSSSSSAAQHMGRSVRVGQVKRKAGEAPADVTEPAPVAKSLASLSPAMGRSSPAQQPSAGESARAFIRQSLGHEITRERLLAGLPRVFGAALRQLEASRAAEVGRAIGEVLAGEELHDGLDGAKTKELLEALVFQAIQARFDGIAAPVVHANVAALLRAVGQALSEGRTEAFDAFLESFVERVYMARWDPEKEVEEEEEKALDAFSHTCRNALVGVACTAANGPSISEHSLQGIVREVSNAAPDIIGSDGMGAVMQSMVAAIDDGTGSALALRDTLLRGLLRNGERIGDTELGIAVAELMKLCPPTPAAEAAILKQVLEHSALAPHLKGATCMALGAQLCPGETVERISALDGELIELIEVDLEEVVEHLVRTASSPSVDACQALVNALLAWRQDIAGHVDHLATAQRDQAAQDEAPFTTAMTRRHEFDVALRAAMASVTPSGSAAWLEMLLRYALATGTGKRPEAVLQKLVDELLPASLRPESKHAADTQAQQRARQARTDALRESIRFGLRLAQEPLDIATAQGISDPERLALLEIGFLADSVSNLDYVAEKIERLATWTAASPWLRFNTLARLFECASNRALTTANFSAARGHMVKHLEQLIATKGSIGPASTRDTKGGAVAKQSAARESKAHAPPEIESLDDGTPWVDPQAIDDYELQARLREELQPLLSLYRGFERASGLDDVLERNLGLDEDPASRTAEIVRHAGFLEVEIRTLERSSVRALLEGNELDRLRALQERLDRALNPNAEAPVHSVATSSSSSSSSSSSQPRDPS